MTAESGGWGPVSTLEIRDATPLDRAAGIAKEIDTGAYSALRTALPDTEAAAPTLGSGWATSTALTGLSTGWNAKLTPLAVQIGGFGERLAETANAYRTALAAVRHRVGSVHMN